MLTFDIAEVVEWSCCLMFGFDGKVGVARIGKYFGIEGRWDYIQEVRDLNLFFHAIWLRSETIAHPYRTVLGNSLRTLSRIRWAWCSLRSALEPPLMSTLPIGKVTTEVIVTQPMAGYAGKSLSLWLREDWSLNVAWQGRLLHNVPGFGPRRALLFGLWYFLRRTTWCNNQEELRTSSALVWGKPNFEVKGSLVMSRHFGEPKVITTINKTYFLSSRREERRIIESLAY